MRVLRNFTADYLKRTIGAMGELLDFYEGRIESLESCPLCEIYRSCVTCPWMIFFEADCTDWKEKERDFGHIAIGRLRENKRPEWVERRVPMLREWIETYEEEIKSRKGRH